MTLVLISLSHFIKAYGIYSLLFILLLIMAFKKSLQNIQIKTAWHRFLLKIPMVSYLIKTINVARYIHTFGILFAAGVSVLETMRVFR